MNKIAKTKIFLHKNPFFSENTNVFCAENEFFCENTN